MADIQSSATLLLCILLPLLIFILTKIIKAHSTPNPNPKLPKSYPIFGSFFSIKSRDSFPQWSAEIVNSTPNLTFVLHMPIGRNDIVITANPANVQHVLKSNFNNYHKGDFLTSTLRDFLGGGIFNVDGESWKFQRQLASHEFNAKSLRNFIDTVVETELSNRLDPILENAAESKTVLDFQDILQRFSFDNICKIAFGYDPAYLSPSLAEENIAVAFNQAVYLSSQRFNSFHPIFWKIKRSLNIGSENQLKIALKEIRDFAKEMIKIKRQELEGKESITSVDLLSRFLSLGNLGEDFVADMVISFMLAGRDTTAAALTWLIYLVSNNPEVETEILKEITEKSESYDEVKDMIYTHASLCESMRLYPPAPFDTKEALEDDVLPDGTKVKKGMRVTYHTYAMGRVEKVWGKDWAEFRPSRWLEKAEGRRKWRFVSPDAYTYPVFQAGPRICLGKDMAFLQMKAVVAGVLRRFRVIPVFEEGEEPVYVNKLTAEMAGGLKVRIEKRGNYEES